VSDSVEIQQNFRVRAESDGTPLGDAQKRCLELYQRDVNLLRDTTTAKRKYRFTPTTAFIPRVVERREVSSRPGTLGGDGEKRRS
jgi:hypothetical protein